jgi:hypothetical protein
MKKLSVILSVLFTMTIFSCSANAFTLTASSNEASVDVEQLAQFDLTVLSDINDRFSVHTDGIKPWMTIEDIGTVSANVPKTFHLYASPSYTIASGTYQVTIQVKSATTNETQEKKIYITVLKSVFASIDKIYVSGSLQPVGYADIKINIKNLDVVTMQNINIIATVSSPSGILSSFNQSIAQLDPLELKSIQRIVSIPPKAEAGKYTVQVSAYYKNKIFNQKSQDFDVVTTPVIEKNYEESPVFIGTEEKITVSNFGNADDYDIEVESQVNGFESNFFFQVKGPQATLSNGVARWSIPKLVTGETVIITYQINYLPIIIIIIIAAIALWFVLFNVRVVEVRKKVVKKSDDDITVHLEIRNRTGKDQESVILKDTIPLIFRVKTFVGLAPTRKRDEEGFALIWRIKKLKADEERVFSYNIVPVLKVAGTMRLPKAKAMYRHLRTVFVIKSNSPLLGWI